MLVEFRVKNYRSFHDEAVLSLVASSDTALKDNCALVGKLRLLKGAAIYGPNASGKTNIIKALDTMQNIVSNSTEYKPGEELPVTPFRLDPKARKQPTSFEVTFYEEGTRYQYGFTADIQQIQKEWLLAFPEGRSKDIPRRLYYRETNLRNNSVSVNFGSFLKGDKKKLERVTRPNALFLSVGAQWNNKQLATVYGWFANKLRVMPSDATWLPVTSSILSDIESEKKNEVSILRQAVTDLLQQADLGISDVKVKSRKLEVPKEFETLPEKVRKIFVDRFKDRRIFDVTTIHKDINGLEDIPFPLREESGGTQRFYELLGPCLETVAHGYTAVIDELEKSLHPLLTRSLIQLILHTAHVKKAKAPQLIFATHDTTLLDPELFRRDQIWFTERDNKGNSRLYSLADYRCKKHRPRKGEAMQKGYLAGRYGAIPILESFGLTNGQIKD